MLQKSFLLICIFLLTQQGRAMCVAQDKVRMRAAPDAKAKVTWVVGRNMPLAEVQKKGAWYQVKDLEGDKHWIHARNVSGKSSCVVVKAKQANLRLGPGSQFGQTDLGSVKKYAAFKKLGRDEEWLKLQDSYGQTHWIHENTVWEPRNYSRVNF